MNVMRQVSVLIWNDDKFPSLDDDAQIVFFHLLTTPLTTTFGLFKAGVNALAEEKRWRVERYHDALRTLTEQNMVRYDASALMIYIPRALKYNPPSNPNILKSWAEIFKSLPNSPLKRAFYDDLKSLLEEKGKEGMTQAFEEVFGDGADLSAKDDAPVHAMPALQMSMVVEVDGDEAWAN